MLWSRKHPWMVFRNRSQEMKTYFVACMTVVFLLLLATVVSSCEAGSVVTHGDAALDTIGENEATDTAAGDTVDGEELPPSLTACSVPSDCILALRGCCWPCGVPSLGDFDAVNEDRQEEHHALVCTDPNPICPGCASMPNPELIATCSAQGHCSGMDIGAEDISACTSNEDCVIRTPECCECGADMTPTSLVSIRADARSRLEYLVCDPDLGCPECMPDYPDDVIPVCDADHHCAAQIIPPP
jgi:hypothetical protein